MTGQTVLAAIQSHGCDATTLRDAAHEATHARQTNLRGAWTRDRVHDAVERLAERISLSTLKGKSRFHSRYTELMRLELEARAVEMLVCKRFDEPYDIEHWAFTCWMETSKAYRIDIGSIDRVVDAIRITAKRVEHFGLVERVVRTRLK